VILFCLRNQDSRGFRMLDAGCWIQEDSGFRMLDSRFKRNQDSRIHDSRIQGFMIQGFKDS
jgi:hypothetical protein